MSIGNLATEPAHGYLSGSSKRRFTLVAGLLGAVFFLALFLLPMLVMFLVMMPMMFDSAASMADIDQAGLWKNELWFIERTAKVNWREPGNPTSLSALRHVNLKDLESAGPPIPLEASKAGSSGRLLPVGDRLWVLEADVPGSMPCDTHCVGCSNERDATKGTRTRQTQPNRDSRCRGPQSAPRRQVRRRVPRRRQ